MNLVFNIVKWVVYSTIGISVVLFVVLQVYKIYLKNSTRINTPNGISSLEEINLGGLQQWIFIRGKDTQNPILLFLHGGPGEPAGGMPSCRKYDAELIKHFTVVHWDQRGAGKSSNNTIPKNKMTMTQMVEDCNQLIDHLRKRFQQQKVFLVAHSAGTPIGILTAYTFPEKIHAYVGVSQITNDFEQQRISYEFILEEAKKSGDEKIQNEIKAMGSPPYDSPEKIFAKAEYVVRYGGFMHKNAMQGILSMTLDYLTSPEYSITEGIQTMNGKGLHFTMNARWEDISNFDITKEMQSIDVPVYFFIGKHDMITPTILVENFYENLEAKKGKHLIVFENSAHIPMVEEKEKYEKTLINLVLNESH